MARGAAWVVEYARAAPGPVGAGHPCTLTGEINNDDAC